MSKNTNLHRARREKNDEWYTRYDEIASELAHYDTSQFRGKTVYCNCDDYRWSNFVAYFRNNYSRLGLKSLVSTNYDIGDGAYHYVYDGKEEHVARLMGNGDFASDECMHILANADIVVTNPPFSIFRDYFGLVMQQRKQVIILGSVQAIKYNGVFQFIMNGEIDVIGMNHKMGFTNTAKEMGFVAWYTNLAHDRINKPLELKCEYNPNDYPRYDNYNVIEVSRTRKIPRDYDGVMGVPLTFIDKWCKEQFEIIGITTTWIELCDLRIDKVHHRNEGYIDGKRVFTRILIRRRIKT